MEIARLRDLVRGAPPEGFGVAERGSCTNARARSIPAGRRRLIPLGVAATGRHGYEPSGWRVLPRALASETVTGRDVFLDLGCGRGRVVAQAAAMPFGRVIGTEIATELAVDARRYVEEMVPVRRRADVEIVVADAVDWAIPDDVTFVYIYNSFSGEVLRGALAQIRASMQRSSRTVTIVYVNPVEPNAFRDVGRFELVRDERRSADDMAGRYQGLACERGPGSDGRLNDARRRSAAPTL